MAAALLAMVCNLTLGRKRYAEAQAEVEHVLQQATRLRDRARRLAEEDEEAYARVADAMKLPRGTEDEQAARKAHVQEALKAAAGPPLETMRVSCDILELARRLARVGNRSAISDVGSAGYLAWAAHGSANLNVDINVNAVEDASWAVTTRAAQRELDGAESALRDVQRIVREAMGGSA
jgi:formiminotetrahydrofolate cyclodeaminase